MKLTPRQLRLLKFWVAHETQPITFADIVRSYWLAWLLLLPPVAFGWYVIQGGWPVIGGMLFGMSIGAFLRDWNRTISLLLTWPLVRVITDWPRVKELIAGGKTEV